MKRLVVMLVGVVVDAADEAEAASKATLPLHHGLLPNLTKVVVSATRSATPEEIAQTS